MFGAFSRLQISSSTVLSSSWSILPIPLSQNLAIPMWSSCRLQRCIRLLPYQASPALDVTHVLNLCLCCIHPNRTAPTRHFRNTWHLAYRAWQPTDTFSSSLLLWPSHSILSLHTVQSRCQFFSYLTRLIAAFMNVLLLTSLLLATSALCISTRPSFR